MHLDYLIVVPTGKSPASTTPNTFLSPPARTIPCDSTPLNLAGFKFVTTITFLPLNSSGEYTSAIPLTIVLVFLHLHQFGSLIIYQHLDVFHI